MKKGILISIIVYAVIVITGFIIALTCGLKYDLLYLDHKEIDISLEQEFNNNDIYELTKQIVGNKNIVVQKVELYEDMVTISLSDINDEELSNLNDKINEKYNLENTVESITITDVPAVQLKDLVRPYIVPSIITIILTLVYFFIYIIIKKRMGANINVLEEMLKVILIILACVILYVSIITIARINISKITIPSIIIVYIIATILSMVYLERNSKIETKKQKTKDKK